MKYFVTINDQEHCVELKKSDNDQYQCIIDDGPMHLVKIRQDGQQLHLLTNNQSRSLMLSLDSGDLTSGGPRSVFRAESEMLRALRTASGGEGTGSGDGTVASPMPGRVVKYLVEEGEQVSAGQGVVVIEAMKMENELKATVDGVVARCFAKPEDLVESGAPLIEIVPES